VVVVVVWWWWVRRGGCEVSAKHAPLVCRWGKYGMKCADKSENRARGHRRRAARVRYPPAVAAPPIALLPPQIAIHRHEYRAC